MRKLRRKAVVIIIEILCQEEVPVGIVVIRLYGEFLRLDAAGGVDGLRFRILLRDKTCQGQFTELQLGLETEKSRTSAYQA